MKTSDNGGFLSLEEKPEIVAKQCAEEYITGVYKGLLLKTEKKGMMFLSLNASVLILHRQSLTPGKSVKVS